MGKLIAGTLIMFIGSIGLAYPAGAAEIPPTNECTQTFERLIGVYMKKVTPGFDKKVERKANREFSTGLAEADCISDAKPLIRNVPAKPFAKVCTPAAAAAAKYFAGPSKRLKPIYNAYRRTIKRVTMREFRLFLRILRLREAGKTAAELKPLRKRQRALSRKENRIQHRYERRSRKIAMPHAYQNYLIFAELLSLRCLGSGYTSGSDEKVGPADKVFRAHEALIFASMYAVLTRETNKSSEKGEATREILESRASSLPFQQG